MMDAQEFADEVNAFLGIDRGVNATMTEHGVSASAWFRGGSAIGILCENPSKDTARKFGAMVLEKARNRDSRHRA
jgi:hypothetical protein